MQRRICVEFKKRVIKAIITGAQQYKEYLLDYEYLLYSKDFIQSQYYILSAYEDNYVHLTGVNALIPPKAFYSKCYSGTIQETDFDIVKGAKNAQASKGTIRSKINALERLPDLFTVKMLAQERFTKGKVNCFVATANTDLTVGFTKTKLKTVPKILMKGNQFDISMPVNTPLVIRRKKGEELFSTIIQGNILEFL
jgi:hypothetical protein